MCCGYWIWEGVGWDGARSLDRYVGSSSRNYVGISGYGIKYYVCI